MMAPGCAVVGFGGRQGTRRVAGYGRRRCSPRLDPADGAMATLDLAAGATARLDSAAMDEMGLDSVSSALRFCCDGL